jgi:hypothetical protein
MELVSDMSHVESHFSRFGDNVSISARMGHGLYRTYHRHRNCFRCTRWVSKVTRIKWKLSFVRLEIVLVLMQDWGTGCVERSVGSKIVLEAPDGTPR